MKAIFKAIISFFFYRHFDKYKEGKWRTKSGFIWGGLILFNFLWNDVFPVRAWLWWVALQGSRNFHKVKISVLSSACTGCLNLKCFLNDKKKTTINIKTAPSWFCLSKWNKAEFFIFKGIRKRFFTPQQISKKKWKYNHLKLIIEPCEMCIQLLVICKLLKSWDTLYNTWQWKGYETEVYST